MITKVIFQSSIFKRFDCGDNVDVEFYRPNVGIVQCDQIKIAKCLFKLTINDFTRKMIDFDTITKIA